jgi:hypothetical protein
MESMITTSIGMRSQAYLHDAHGGEGVRLTMHGFAAPGGQAGPQSETPRLMVRSVGSSPPTAVTKISVCVVCGLCRAQKPQIRPVTRSFFELARPAPARRPRWGIQTVHRATHLFPEHCLDTGPHVSSPDRRSDPSAIMGTVPGSGPAQRSPEGNPWSGPRSE